MIGQQLEHYRVDAQQGRGILGTVYRAYDTSLIRPVALKIIDPQFRANPDLQAHIMRQARSAAKLIHPSIATIYNFANNGDQFYIVSEFVAGHSLSNLLAQLSIQQKSLRISEVLYLVADIADALSYAHQQGVLHRNLKPTNILLKPTDGDLHRHLTLPVRVLVTDFGMTHHVSGDVKSNPYEFGIGLNYMSPEQCIGSRLDGRSDIYVLGLILYELLGGKRPFTIQTPIDAMLKQTLETAPLLTDFAPDVPADVVALVNQAIAKQPQKRMSDMRQFADMLRQAAANVHDSPHRQSIQKLLTEKFTVDPSSAYTKPQPIINQQNGPLPVREEELAAILQEALVYESDSVALYTGENGRFQNTNTPPMPQLITSAPSPPPQPAEPLADKLIIQRAGYEPLSVPLDQDLLVIGRSKASDVTLEAPDVSRRHVQLEKTASGWQVTDLNSTGGTYWGGHKLLPNVPEQLNTTQLLRIGPFSLRWQSALASRPFVPTFDEDDEPVTKLHAVPLNGIQSGSPKGQFSLMLNPIVLTVNPGEQEVMQIELFNQSAIPDNFKVQLLDLPEIANSMVQSAVFLAPGERATLPITLTVSDQSGLAAGHHPFQVLVRRESDPTDTAVVSARLTVGQAERFTIGVWPLEIPQNGMCQVLIRNEGNTNGRFSMMGQSSNPNITFLGERGQVRLDPGQATTLALSVASEKRPLFGRRQHIPFEIKVRSETGSEKTETGRLELNPQFPAWILPAAEIAIVLLFVLFAVSSYFSNNRNRVVPVQAQEETSLPFGEPYGERPAEDVPPTAVPVVIVEEPTAVPVELIEEQLPADTDGDGLTDEEEVDIYGTDPTVFDTDADGLNDGDEVFVYETDPIFADTDLDGVNDGDEIAFGTDPRRFDSEAEESGDFVDESSEGSGFVDEDVVEETAVPTATPEPTFDDEDVADDPTPVPDESDDDNGNFVPEDPTSEPTTEPTAEPTVAPTNEPEPTAVPTTAPSAQSVTVDLTTLNNGTGSVSASGNVSNNPAAPITVGDTDGDDTVRAFYSYDISNIPIDATIESATLSFSPSVTINGDPFADLDCLQIDAVEFDLPLDSQDYLPTSFYLDCVTTLPTTYKVAVDVQAAVDFELDAVQFSLSFTIDSDNDGQADQLLLSSPPTLTVTYSAP